MERENRNAPPRRNHKIARLATDPVERASASPNIYYPKQPHGCKAASMAAGMRAYRMERASAIPSTFCERNARIPPISPHNVTMHDFPIHMSSVPPSLRPDVNHVKDATVGATMDSHRRGINPTVAGNDVKFLEMTLCDDTLRRRCPGNPIALPRRPKHHAVVDIVVAWAFAIHNCCAFTGNSATKFRSGQQSRRLNAEC